MTKVLDVSAVVNEVLFYTANQTRWYTDNINMWLAEIHGHSSSKEDEDRRENLRDEIQKFFELVLEYIMRSVSHINKALVAKAAKAVIQPDSWWKQGLDKLKDRRASLEEHLKLTAEQKEKRRKRISAQNKLISTFKPAPAIDMPGTLTLNSNRAPHTCRWFRKHPTFDSWWRDGSKHLLVSADPGSGKTTLSAYLVEKVLPKYCPKAIVLYYFFDYASRKDPATALSSLLYQLFRAKRELADDHEDAIEGDETSTTGLSGILAKVTHHASCPPVICVLDALDECSKEGQRALSQLADKLPSTSKLRFVMTTRSYPDIIRQFTGPRWSHISAEAAKSKFEIQQEIEVALDLKLKVLVQKRGFGPKAQAALSEAIREKGRHQTTYLWLKLLFMSLEAPECDYRPSALKALVNGSLKSIDAAYAMFLQGVAPEVQDALKVVFHLLIAANRPLSIHEVELALRANARWDAGQLEGDENDALETLEDPQGFHKWLRDSCHLFLTVHGGKVRFLHLTAQEFLLQRRGGQDTPWYSVDPCEAERVMVESCLPYLSLRQFSTEPFERQVRRCTQEITTFAAAAPVFSREYGFLMYALEYWPEHFRNYQGDWKANPQAIGRELTACYLNLFRPHTQLGSGVQTAPPWLQLCQWLHGWGESSRPTGKNGLHGLGIMNTDIIEVEQTTYGSAVARWDHHQMLKHFITIRSSSSEQTLARPSGSSAAQAQHCGMLLHLAVIGSAFGCINLLMSLPSIKSFINEKTSFGQTPLCWAASVFDKRTCNIEAANILLNKGALKTIPDQDNVLPFGHLMHVIQHHWAHIDWKNQNRDYIALALRLLLNKAETAQLSEPARSLYQQSLNLFLAMSPKLNADHLQELEPILQTYSTWPPTASRDSLQSSLFRRPNFLAIYRRSVLGQIIDSGADINPGTPSPNDRLSSRFDIEQFGQSPAKERMVQNAAFLLHGFRENISLRKRLVKFAVHSGRIDVFAFLLRDHLIPGLIGTANDGLLHVAIPANSPEIVRFLLSKRYAAGAGDANGDTPLHHINLRGGEKAAAIIEMLVAAGADVNAKDRKGKTVLSRVRARHPHIVGHMDNGLQALIRHRARE